MNRVENNASQIQTPNNALSCSQPPSRDLNRDFVGPAWVPMLEAAKTKIPWSLLYSLLWKGNLFRFYPLNGNVQHFNKFFCLSKWRDSNNHQHMPRRGERWSAKENLFFPKKLKFSTKCDLLEEYMPVTSLSLIAWVVEMRIYCGNAIKKLDNKLEVRVSLCFKGFVSTFGELLSYFQISYNLSRKGIVSLWK